MRLSYIYQAYGYNKNKIVQGTARPAFLQVCLQDWPPLTEWFEQTTKTKFQIISKKSFFRGCPKSGKDLNV